MQREGLSIELLKGPGSHSDRASELVNSLNRTSAANCVVKLARLIKLIEVLRVTFLKRTCIENTRNAIANVIRSLLHRNDGRYDTKITKKIHPFAEH